MSQFRNLNDFKGLFLWTGDGKCAGKFEGGEPDNFSKKNPGRGNSPTVVRIALLWVVALFHVVEHPVPHDEEAGNNHIREQPGAEECPGEDEFSVHHHHPQASAGTVSAQVSTFVRMLSSE